MINKKRLAKEWIWFLLSLLVGFVVTLLAYNVLVPRWWAHSIAWSPDPLDQFLRDLFGEDWRLGTWLGVLAPYFALQLVRSIIWSIKILKSKETGKL